MKLGEKQVLTVVKIVDFGVYLGNDEERVLLPKKQVPEGIEPGDPVEVFLYRRLSGRARRRGQKSASSGKTGSAADLGRGSD